MKFRNIKRGDIKEFLSLHNTVFGSMHDEQWFDWKYYRVSELPDMPVVVVENDGNLIAAVGFFALRLSKDDRNILGVQPVDIMIHPNQRDQNIFTQLMNNGREIIYPDSLSILEFGWPNEETVKIWTQLQQWDVACENNNMFRIQNPIKYIFQNQPLSALNRFVRIFDLPIRAWVRLQDRRKATSTQEYTVDKLLNPPVDVLEYLYRSTIPDKIHVVRDKSFYESRLAAPHVSYETYITRNEGDPQAAIILSKPESGKLMHIIDVLPLGSNRSEEQINALKAAIRTALSANKGASGVGWSPVLPTSVLQEFSFDMSAIVSEIVNSQFMPPQLSGFIPKFGTSTIGVRSFDDQMPPSISSNCDEWELTGIEKDFV